MIRCRHCFIALRHVAGIWFHVKKPIIRHKAVPFQTYELR